MEHFDFGKSLLLQQINVGGQEHIPNDLEVL